MRIVHSETLSLGVQVVHVVLVLALVGGPVRIVHSETLSLGVQVVHVHVVVQRGMNEWQEENGVQVVLAVKFVLQVAEFAL